MKQQYDLIIIGGGMVGASLACALLPAAERLSLSIAVIETHPLPEGELSYNPSYDARATALAYGSRSSYELMGVWDTLQQHLTPIEHIHVSDRGHFGATRLHARDENVSALGYVVENHWLGRVLLDRLHKPDVKCVDFICPAEVTALTPGVGQMGVTLYTGDQQHEISAELVVMADGQACESNSEFTTRSTAMTSMRSSRTSARINLMVGWPGNDLPIQVPWLCYRWRIRAACTGVDWCGRYLTISLKRFWASMTLHFLRGYRNVLAIERDALCR